jgi:hypothetical protein
MMMLTPARTTNCYNADTAQIAVTQPFQAAAAAAAAAMLYCVL